MAHTRKRQVHLIASKLLSANPILGVFGHRQVGKTTWINEFTESYVTFDVPEIRQEATLKPTEYIDKISKLPMTPIAIDECQMVPEIFPVLKEFVRKKPKPGKWLLSGSVRFSSRKAIRESLAGRMLFFEMYPLVLSEIDHRNLPNAIEELFKMGDWSSAKIEILHAAEFKKRSQSLTKYLELGGLPGICFLRDSSHRLQKLEDLHRLILDRDLRLVHSTSLSQEVLYRFLKLISQAPWNGVNYSSIQKELRIAPQTQKKLLYALESIFMIRRIPLTGGRSGEVVLMEDQFEEKCLGGKDLSEEDRYISLFYRNIRAQFGYRQGRQVSYSSYRTRYNAYVPLVVEIEGEKIGFQVSLNGEPTLSQIRSAESFIKKSRNARVVFLSIGNNHSPEVRLSGKILVIPMVYLI